MKKKQPVRPKAKRLRKRGIRKKHIEPFMLLDSDPAKPNRLKQRKVLTSLSRSAIVKVAIKPKFKRKDNKVKHTKTKTKFRLASLVILTGFAGIGATTLLGGGLKDAVVASILVALLFAEVADIL